MAEASLDRRSAYTGHSRAGRERRKSHRKQRKTRRGAPTVPPVPCARGVKHRGIKKSKKQSRDAGSNKMRSTTAAIASVAALFNAAVASPTTLLDDIRVETEQLARRGIVSPQQVNASYGTSHLCAVRSVLVVGRHGGIFLRGAMLPPHPFRSTDQAIWRTGCSYLPTRLGGRCLSSPLRSGQWCRDEG